MAFQDELRKLGERSGELALTESIIAAYEALLESDMTADTPIPDSKVYVNADGSQVIGMTWGDDPQNIDPDADEDDPESYLAQGYNCYTYADLYDVDEGFDLSQLPTEPWELDSLEGKGLSLVANMEQHMYKKSELPSDEDALGEYVNPDEGWKLVSK